MNRFRPHITLLVILLLFKFLPASFIEIAYSNWLYPKIHSTLYLIFGYLPFPGFYLVLAVALLYIVKWIKTLFSDRTMGEKIIRISGQLCKWVIWYFILWGFNYGRIPLEKKLALNIRPLTQQEIITEIDVVAKDAVNIRERMEEDTVPIPETFFQYENSANDKLAYTLNQWKYDAFRVRGRELKEDLLLRFDVGGQYMPYTGEANIDKGVHYYSKPYYMIHEMCHANGFCDEATCNFMSYATAFNFSNTGFQYSAQINYLKYLLSDLYETDSVTCLQIRKNFPPVLRYDLDLLKKHALQHSFKTSVIGEAINNTYLKLMGIPEGTRSYDKMVLLVYAWRHRPTSQIDNKPLF